MINKREAIMFLIEECYKKFPELMEEIPEEKMYKTLEKNISVIKAGGKSEDYAGLYYPASRKIKLLNKGKINLEEIKQDQDTTGVLTHEGVHALFRKSAIRSRHRFSFRTS